MNARNFVYGAIPAAIVGGIIAIVGCQTKPKTAEAHVINGIEVRVDESRGFPRYTLEDPVTEKRLIAEDVDRNRGVDFLTDYGLGLNKREVNELLEELNYQTNYNTATSTE